MVIFQVNIFIGDINMRAYLVDYTNLTLEWAEDVETKLCNEVVLMARKKLSSLFICRGLCLWGFGCIERLQ